VRHVAAPGVPVPQLSVERGEHDGTV
jgi:hypothetical protein